MPAKEIIGLLLAAALLIMSVTACILLVIKLYNGAGKHLLTGKAFQGKEFETQLLKAQLELQEQTLQNISQEIHDNIGQALTFAKLNINTIDLGKLEESQNKLAASGSLITKAIQDLRNLSRTSNIDFIHEAGLVASIECQLHFLEKTGVYTTFFHTTDDYYGSEPDTEIVLFRVVQELLNNIVKHAEATTIRVSMDYRQDMLVICVTDNGKGFMQPVDVLWYNGNGLGLRNMKKRIGVIRGRIYIDSGPGRGTSIHIEVPRKVLAAVPVVVSLTP
jgi:two-component system NarL family sensor kinase